MWIYTIVDVQTGEILYYLISMADWVYPGEGRGVTAKRPLASVLGAKVLIDNKSLEFDMVVDVGELHRGDLLARELFR